MEPFHATARLYFYPRSPCGERQRFETQMGEFLNHFYPRSPCGERLRVVEPGLVNKLFLSTLSLRRATAAHGFADAPPHISIHALLAESDGSHYRSSRPFKRFLSTLSLRRATTRKKNQPGKSNISIHALLAESDIINNIVNGANKIFLSTLSLRRATKISFLSRLLKKFLSTLSLRRATLRL